MQFYTSYNILKYFKSIYKSVFFIGFCILICFLLQVNQAQAKTTSTKLGGNGAWGDGSNWTNGVPADGDIINIDHVLNFTNVNINIGANTTFNFNAGSSGSSIPQSLGMGSSTAILNIYTNVSFAGGINLNSGVINVYTGGTLTVTNQINQAGTLINIEEGANFNVTGNYLNNGGNIAVDGLLSITGNYNGQNAAAVVTGSGDITTTGSMIGINQSSIFGVINPNCGGPNCSGRNLCGRIASSTPRAAAYCTTAIVLTGSVNNNGGFTPTYKWQSSLSNTEAGFADISGATNTTLTVSPPTKTYYRVKVTVNACTSISPVSVVSVSTCGKIWTGLTNKDWNTATNWSSNQVPTVSDDVVIPNPSPRYPEINSGIVANAKDIIINSGSSLKIFDGGTLNVYGNFTNNGTFTAGHGTIVTFKGSAPQAVSGTPFLHNVTIDNTNGVSLFSTTTINGTLKLSRGALSTGNYLTIAFDTSGNIAYNPADLGSIDGNVTGRRNASAKSHYIAAPFSGVTSAQVDATTPLWVSPYWKMYSRNYTAQNWVAVTNTITSMPLGTGFSLSLPTAAPLKFTGSYDHSFVLTGESYDNSVSGVYIFVGNPYPSTLDWNNASGWTKTGVQEAIYLWDGASSQANSYVNGVGTNGGTPYIPAMQAFLVATDGNGGNASVSINNNARTSLHNPSFLRVASDDNIIRLTVKAEGEGIADDAVIRFNESATADFDSDFDAYKIINTGLIPSVYTKAGTINYSINSFESVDAASTIPVCVKLPADGNYTLNINSSDPAIEYILIDKKLGTDNLISGPDYQFSGLKTDDVNRFELQLRTATTTPVVSSTNAAGLQIYSSAKGFVIQSGSYSGSSAEIEILDVTGKSVQRISDKNLASTSTFIPLELAEGAYLVKVTVDNKNFVQLISLLK